MSELINRPDEFYVGRKQYASDPLPLAFLTPFDTTAAFQKRKQTVDSWAKMYNANTLTPIQIKNDALAGFRIAKSVKRNSGWGSGNVVWRIEDPRGFEWEIPSANLAQIITQTGISAGGVIQEKCIIARVGGTNILVPEGSDLWDKMESDLQKRDQMKKAKIISHLNVGDFVKFKNGEEKIYLGKRKLMLEIRTKPAYNQFYPVPSPTKKASKSEYHIFCSADSFTKNNYGIFCTAYKSKPAVIEVDYTKNIDPAALDIATKTMKFYYSFAGNTGEEGYPIGLA